MANNLLSLADSNVDWVRLIHEFLQNRYGSVAADKKCKEVLTGIWYHGRTCPRVRVFGKFSEILTTNVDAIDYEFPHHSGASNERYGLGTLRRYMSFLETLER